MAGPLLRRLQPRFSNVPRLRGLLCARLRRVHIALQLAQAVGDRGELCRGRVELLAVGLRLLAVPRLRVERARV